MKLSEAANNYHLPRVDEAKTLSIGKYVWSYENPQDDKPKKIESSAYAAFKKKGVGGIVAIDDAAPGTKRMIYKITKIGPDKIDLVQVMKK